MLNHVCTNCRKGSVIVDVDFDQPPGDDSTAPEIESEIKQRMADQNVSIMLLIACRT